MIGFAFTMVTGYATKPKMHQTGFLKDCSQLKEDPKGLVQWMYIKDGVDFGAYDKIIVDHVTFFFKEDAEYKGIHPNELTEVAHYLHNAYVEALSGVYSFTDKPGPGILRLRTAITDLVPSKPVSGTMSAIKPLARGQPLGPPLAHLLVVCEDKIKSVSKNRSSRSGNSSRRPSTVRSAIITIAPLVHALKAEVTRSSSN